MVPEKTVLDVIGRIDLSPDSRRLSGIGPGDWVEFLVIPEGLVLRKVEVVATQGTSDTAGVAGHAADTADRGRTGSSGR